MWSPRGIRDPVAAFALAVVLAGAGGTAALAAIGAFPIPPAVRTGFTVVGAAIALGVYLATRRGESAGETPADASAIRDGHRRLKVVLALGALALTATVLTDDRLLPLAVFLPVGYLLTVDLIRRGGPTGSALGSIAVLFAVPVLAKYHTTGFYFGGTDTFAHVNALNRLAATGTIASLPYGYDYFPGFHLLAGAVSMLGHLRPYDAVLSTGTVVFVALVPTVYLLATRLFDDRRLGLAAALAVTAVDLVAYHALYFFPQALAIALVVVGFHAAASLPATRTARRRRGYSVYLVGLVCLLAITHHLTYVFLLGPVLVAGAVVALSPSLLSRTEGESAASPRELFRFRRSFPVVFGVLVIATYLVFSPATVLFDIASSASLVVTEVFAGGESAPVYLYGVDPVVDSVGRSLQWLALPTGVYYTLVTAVALVGFYEVLSSLDRYAHRAGVLVVGIAATPLFVPLPLAIPQVERVLLVLAFFLVFPLGIGIVRTLGRPQVDRRYAALAVVLVAALGTSAAFTTLAADDIDEVYFDEPDAQTTMSEREYAAIETTARFVDDHTTGPVASDYVTHRAVDSTATSAAVTDGLRAGPDGLSTSSERAVVRSAWTDHSVLVGAGNSFLAPDRSWFGVSRDRFDRAIAERTVVHDGGGTYVLADPDGFDGVFGGEVP
ncbi:hypothetical protein [Saliphagus sp. LR7]|uniref:hypothetical protein n=1 Tax=Saliphagus sp. LR7 TaxID=2282654 RepID=UPI000DF81500|nr:hypothetical protein [Saliphagus sp. LR7]